MLFKTSLLCFTVCVTSIGALPPNSAINSPLGKSPVKIELVDESSERFKIKIEFSEIQIEQITNPDHENLLKFNLNGLAQVELSKGVTIPYITRLAHVPEGYTLKPKINNIEDMQINSSGIMLKQDGAKRELRKTCAEQVIEIGNVGYMRWLRVVPISIKPIYRSPIDGNLRIVSNLEIEFVLERTNDKVPMQSEYNNRYWSLAFDEFFEEMVLNYPETTEILAGGKVIQRGSYLIITDEALARATIEFADWKRQKGFDVVVAPIYSANDATSADEIKSYIQEAYDEWDRPPEFVLLVGDVNRPGIRLPAYYITNPDEINDRDVTDHPYSLLQGEDYFPDLFIGRISSDSPSPTDVLKVLRRVIHHERDLLDQEDLDLDAFQRATLFAGNYSNEAVAISTPVEASMWFADKLREFAYHPDEIYYRGPQDENSSAPIIESINTNVNMVVYRGWSDARGTHYPEFYKQDLDELENGYPLPAFLMFCCNTGDFGNDNQSECFNEYALTRGSSDHPAGALVTFGPTNLHTRTKYNNAAFAGYAQGLLYNNFRVFGQLCLRSKIEILSGYPHMAQDGGDVEFYFNIYNILGDPETNLYLNAPERIRVTHSDVVYKGDSFLELIVADEDDRSLSGALATICFEDDQDQVSVLTDNQGRALLPLDIADQESLTITVITKDMAPYRSTLSIEQPEHHIGFESVDVFNEYEDSRLISGSPVELIISLKNNSEDVSRGVRAQLDSPIGNIEFLSDYINYGDIEAGNIEAGNSPYRIQLRHILPEGYEIPFTLNISDSEDNHFEAMFWLPVRTAQVVYMDHSFQNMTIEPGESTEMTVLVENSGSLDISNLTAQIHTHDNAVQIVRDTGTFGNVAVGENANCAGNPFRLRALPGVTPGRSVVIRSIFFNDDGDELSKFMFPIIIGSPTIDDPLGPDTYGYFAYEHSDDQELYSEIPEYNWLELDPEYDGQGATNMELEDDASRSISLPFTFKYYGEEFDTLTICSNGWVSFGRTWMRNFRNWSIPSSYGPPSMIAVYWDDLVGLRIDEESHQPLNVFYRYDENEGRFIVEWSRVFARSEEDDHRQTFELILFDPEKDEYKTHTGDGEILFQYLEVELVDYGETNYASVGIQNRDHQQGLEITHSGLFSPGIDSLRNRTAIKFTTDPPDTFLFTNDLYRSAPEEFTLYPLKPNPFNSTIKVGYSIDRNSQVELSLYNLRGRRLVTFENGYHAVGTYQRAYDMSAYPSGMYILSLRLNDQIHVRKAILIK